MFNRSPVPAVKHLGHKVVIASLLALAIVVALSLVIIGGQRAIERGGRLLLRDARQAMLAADFDVAIVRAAGEAATFAVSRNPQYLREADEAVDRAHAAIEALRATLGDQPVIEGLEGRHIGFLQRQRRLLESIETGVQAVRRLAPDAGADAVRAALDQVFAYEPSAEALRHEVAEHREHEYQANELAIARALRLAIAMVVAALGVLSVMIALAWYGTRRFIVQPIDQLSGAAAAVAAGDLDQSIVVRGHDEIGRLQESFNFMVGELRGQHQALQARKAQLTANIEKVMQAERNLQLVLESGGLALWEIDCRSRLLIRKAQWRAIVGGQHVEQVVTLDAAMAQIHDDDRARVNAALEQCMTGATESFSCEHRIRHAGGHWIWVACQGRIAERDDSGRARRIVGTYADIGARKRAEIT